METIEQLLEMQINKVYLENRKNDIDISVKV